jgi:hypothetical protein
MDEQVRRGGTACDYQRDFYSVAIEPAALLRAGRLAEADIANIAEKVESLGRSEKREPVTRFAVLLAYPAETAVSAGAARGKLAADDQGIAQQADRSY